MSTQANKKTLMDLYKEAREGIKQLENKIGDNQEKLTDAIKNVDRELISECNFPSTEDNCNNALEDLRKITNDLSSEIFENTDDGSCKVKKVYIAANEFVEETLSLSGGLCNEVFHPQQI